MIRLLTLLSILFSIISCNKIESRVKYSRLNKKDSITYIYNDKNFTGIAFREYDNGELEFEKKYLGGKLYGYSSFWYVNGQQQKLSYYKFGEIDFSEPHYQWYRNGHKRLEIIPFENKLSIKMYHENGKISSETIFHSSDYNNVEFTLYDENENRIESSFKEYLLFLKEFQRLDFGYKPELKDSSEFKSRLKDSLKQKNNWH
jgi:antitoxin component YwqK of YwqJK toxin-antitoxin module